MTNPGTKSYDTKQNFQQNFLPVQGCSSLVALFRSFSGQAVHSLQGGQLWSWLVLETFRSGWVSLLKDPFFLDLLWYLHFWTFRGLSPCSDSKNILSRESIWGSHAMLYDCLEFSMPRLAASAVLRVLAGQIRVPQSHLIPAGFKPRASK